MNEKKKLYLTKIQAKQARKKCVIWGIISTIIFVLNPFFYPLWLLAYVLPIGDVGVGFILLSFIINPIFWIMFVGNILEKSNARKRNYIIMLDNKRVDSLDNLAGANGVTYDKVKEEINKLLQEGLVSDLYIDDMNRKIIYTDNLNTIAQEKTITCPACGASNTINVNGKNTCEYCGAVLN